MAERRMFSKSVIDSDIFQDMSAGARLLYYEIGMHADDDGFLNSPKRLIRSIGASTSDLDELIDNGLILTFNSGVIVVRHWLVNNQIRRDRYHGTVCTTEKSVLVIENGQPYRFTNDDDEQYTEDGFTNDDDERFTDDGFTDNGFTEDSQGKDSQGKDREEKDKDKGIPPLPPCGGIPPAGGDTLSISDILKDTELEKLKGSRPNQWEDLCNTALRRVDEGKDTFEGARAWLLTL